MEIYFLKEGEEGIIFTTTYYFLIEKSLDR